MDTFSLIKMRKVKGQMEGISVAEPKKQVSCAMSSLSHVHCRPFSGVG